ncbi:S41 family peptidase [Marinifilum sp.]|uniref:S41 family peptidase n=1 Tax=Marinifilum sp. TaxID=2033137 RepID=UPI003BA9F54A
MTENVSIKSFKFFFFLFTASFLLASCDDDGTYNIVRNSNTIYASIDETMGEWYLWNEDLPNITPSSYSSVNDYFEALLVSQDRWSYIANLDALLAYLENGTYVGYGLAFKYDNNNELRVKLIFEESPLAAKGITRGWKLIEINGKLVADISEDEVLNELDKSNSNFVFENNLGEQKVIDASQQELDQNSVLSRKVIDYEGTKVAYLAFDSFLGSSEDELNEAFDHFKENQAKELVLDLRYNGGGSNYISNQLAGLITGNAFKGDVYSKTFHNTSKSTEDFSEAFFDQPSAHGFDRVFIITTERTASASEMVINGLKPYLGSDKVILIGSQTQGKPVGMYVFEEPALNLAIVPISFSITNANDEGNYFDGIQVDFEISDDLSHDFGDPEESNLQAALQYIDQDNFPAITAIKSLSTTEREFKKKGFELLIDAN